MSWSALLVMGYTLHGSQEEEDFLPGLPLLSRIGLCQPATPYLHYFAGLGLLPQAVDSAIGGLNLSSASWLSFRGLMAVFFGDQFKAFQT